jgi:hypothetical protein
MFSDFINSYSFSVIFLSTWKNKFVCQSVGLLRAYKFVIRLYFVIDTVISPVINERGKAQFYTGYCSSLIITNTCCLATLPLKRCTERLAGLDNRISKSLTQSSLVAEITSLLLLLLCVMACISRCFCLFCYVPMSLI